MQASVALIIDQPARRWYSISRKGELLGLVSADYQGDVVSAARQYWPQFIGEMRIDENEPDEAFACKKLIKYKLKNPYQKRPAIIVGDNPKYWWWADYTGHEIPGYQRNQLLCFVACNYYHDAMTAVLERWPQFAGKVSISEIVTMRNDMTEKWRQGAFKIL